MSNETDLLNIISWYRREYQEQEQMLMAARKRTRALKRERARGEGVNLGRFEREMMEILRGKNLSKYL